MHRAERREVLERHLRRAVLADRHAGVRARRGGCSPARSRPCGRSRTRARRTPRTSTRTASSCAPGARPPRRPSAARRCTSRSSAPGSPSRTPPRTSSSTLRRRARRRRRVPCRARAARRRTPCASRPRCRARTSAARARPVSNTCGCASPSGLCTSTTMLRMPPSSSIALSGSSSALPCQPSLFSTAFTPLPLIVRAMIAVGIPVVERASSYARSIASTSWPSISIAAQPNDSTRRLYESMSQPCIVSPRWPSRLMSRIAVRLSRLGERGVLERLPHRALRELAVAAEAPDAVGKPIEPLAGERDADRDRQALAERAGRDVDPGDLRSRMSLEPRPELAERQQLLVRDRAGGLEDRVEQRRRVTLREDQVVVARVVRAVEVVAEVLREQDGHEVRGRHRGRRMARLGNGRRADRIDAQLLAKLAPELWIGHGLSLRTRRGVT